MRQGTGQTHEKGLRLPQRLIPRRRVFRNCNRSCKIGHNPWSKDHFPFLSNTNWLVQTKYQHPAPPPGQDLFFPCRLCLIPPYPDIYLIPPLDVGNRSCRGEEQTARRVLGGAVQSHIKPKNLPPHTHHACTRAHLEEKLRRPYPKQPS